MMKPIRDKDIRAFEGRTEIERLTLRQAAMWKDSRLQGYYGLWMVLLILSFILASWICETLLPGITTVLPILAALAIVAPFWPLYRNRFNPLLNQTLDENQPE